MPTKAYSDSLRDFCAYYEIDFAPEDLKANKKILKTLGKENLAPISNNEAANRYFDALTAALTLYTQKKIGVGSVSAYQTFGEERHLNISIHDFIREFELTMQDKFASDREEGKDTLRDRKPFEGLKFEDVARGAMNRISGKFNKSLANVWASNIVDDKNVMYDLIDYTNNSMDKLKNARVNNLSDIDCMHIKSIVTAKKAMVKVREGRSGWWALAPWNWSRNSEEKRFLNKLSDTLELYKKNGLSDELISNIMENDNQSILRGVSEEYEECIEDYKTRDPYDRPWIKEEDIPVQENNDKEIELQDFFKLGYIPNINNLEKENELAQKAEQSLNATIESDSIIKGNSKEAEERKKSYQMAREVFTNNYQRLKDITSQKEENRANNINFLSQIYKVQDETWMEQHPDYVAPEISEIADNSKVQVDLSDVFNHKEHDKSSEKIQEVPEVKHELKK